MQELHTALLSTIPAKSGRIVVLVRPERDQDKARAMAERIKQARRKAGLSREQVADSLEVHRNTVANWERPGKPTFPERNLGPLARLLNVKEEWLLYGDEVLTGDVDMKEVLAELTNELRQSRKDRKRLTDLLDRLLDDQQQ